MHHRGVSNDVFVIMVNKFYVYVDKPKGYKQDSEQDAILKPDTHIYIFKKLKNKTFKFDQMSF